MTVFRQAEHDDRLSPIVTTSHTPKTCPPLLRQVIRTVQSRDLLQRGQHVLVAVSGGPDSIALLSLMHHLAPRWSLTLTAAHCNYGLRGLESEGDEQFVVALCRELNVPLHIRKLTLPVGARCPSVQAAARDLRYQALSDIATHCGADRIAVGHTADDQAETVLLWILRGAGLTGLSGMPAFRDGHIIRPLYEATRHDILTYLRNINRSFREDSSNAKPLYLRNRIRHDVMPLLRQVVPSSVEALCRLAEICREDDRYLEGQVAALAQVKVMPNPDGQWSINRARLQELPRAIQRRVVRAFLRQGDVQRRAPSLRSVETVLRLASTPGSGSSLDVTGGCVVFGGDEVQFVTNERRRGEQNQHSNTRTIEPELLQVPGHVVWSGTRQIIQVQEQSWRGVLPTLDKYCIAIDSALISQPLLVRSWQPGDRFCPLGMNGHSKKLQDFFMDLHIPNAVRRRIPLVVAPEGIVWIVGYRQDHRWMSTATTDRCLVFTADPPSTPLTEGIR